MSMIFLMAPDLPWPWASARMSSGRSFAGTRRQTAAWPRASRPD